MKRLTVLLTVGVLIGTLIMAIGLGLAQHEPKSEMPAAQRYLPDSDRPAPPWRPDPDRQKTLYAERIILRGEACQITIDATGKQPGILVQATATGERCHLYISPDGTAALGVATPDRRELSAGMFTDKRIGYLQVADPGGVHMFSGRDLDRGGDRWGAMKQ